MEIGSSRWVPRFGSRSRGRIKAFLGTLNSGVAWGRGVQVRRKEGVFRGGARSGRRRSDRRTAVRGHGVHVAERDHSRRARVGARPWSWSSAGGSPDALAKAGVALVVLKEIRVGGKHDIPTKVMATTLFALFAEVERDLISERTREGPRPGQGLGPEARPPEALAWRLAPRWQGGREPALPPTRRRRRRVWRGFDERVDVNCSGVMAPRRRVSPSSRPPRAFGRADPGEHAPAPWPGRDCTGQRRLAARPFRPQDARRRIAATVTGPPPRSCAGNGTR